MLVTTTPTIEGKPIEKYYGLVSGETIIGTDIFKDIFLQLLRTPFKVVSKNISFHSISGNNVLIQFLIIFL